MITNRKWTQIRVRKLYHIYHIFWYSWKWRITWKWYNDKRLLEMLQKGVGKICCVILVA